VEIEKISYIQRLCLPGGRINHLQIQATEKKMPITEQGSFSSQFFPCQKKLSTFFPLVASNPMIYLKSRLEQNNNKPSTTHAQLAAT